MWDPSGDEYASSCSVTVVAGEVVSENVWEVVSRVCDMTSNQSPTAAVCTVGEETLVVAVTDDVPTCFTSASRSTTQYARQVALRVPPVPLSIVLLRVCPAPVAVR